MVPFRGCATRITRGDLYVNLVNGTSKRNVIQHGFCVYMFRVSDTGFDWVSSDPAIPWCVFWHVMVCDCMSWYVHGMSWYVYWPKYVKMRWAGLSVVFWVQHFGIPNFASMISRLLTDPQRWMTQVMVTDHTHSIDFHCALRGHYPHQTSRKLCPGDPCGFGPLCRVCGRSSWILVAENKWGGP